MVQWSSPRSSQSKTRSKTTKSLDLERQRAESRMLMRKTEFGLQCETVLSLKDDLCDEINTDITYRYEVSSDSDSCSSSCIIIPPPTPKPKTSKASSESSKKRKRKAKRPLRWASLSPDKSTSSNSHSNKRQPTPLLTLSSSPAMTPPIPPDHRQSLARSRFCEWPKQTSKDVCFRRHQILNEYIRGHDWYMSNKFHLLRTLILSPYSIPGWEEFYKRYPLIFDIEWQCGHLIGVGDLLCTDGDNQFLVVELKSIGVSGSFNFSDRSPELKYGEAETVTYARTWHARNPQVVHTIGLFVCERYSMKIIELHRISNFID